MEKQRQGSGIKTIVIKESIMQRVLNFCLLAFLVLSFASGCSKDDDSLTDIDAPKLRLSVKANRSNSVPSKALVIEDRGGNNYLASYWATTDAVYVHNAQGPSIGTLNPREAGASAYLDGEVNPAGLSAGTYLCFSYPISSFNWNYTGQDGTLETISQHYDYLFADAYINSIDGSTINIDPLTFSAQQAIVKFTLVDADSNPVYPTQLTLTAKNSLDEDILIQSGSTCGNLVINVDQGVPHNEIYAAIRFMGTSTAASFTLEASVGEYVTYEYEKTTETTFQNGKYYEIRVKLSNMTVNPSSLNINDLVFNFNFTENASEWTKEGPIFVFFDGVTTGYYAIIHDGYGWQDGEFVDLGGTEVSDILESGKVTAVYLDWGEQLDVSPLSYSAGKWRFLKNSSATEGWKYLRASKVSFTLSAVTVGMTETVSLNSSLSLSEPSYTSIAVDPGLTGTTFTKFACNNLIPAGLASISSDGTVNDIEGSAGDWINLISNYGCAKLVNTPDNVYYYALHTNSLSTDRYYHLFDTDNLRLTLKGLSYPHAEIVENEGDWLEVGINKYVTIRGVTWWSTNLSDDRYSPLPHPWTTAELTWTTVNQWDGDRVSKSLSEATFDYNSELPEPFNWYNSTYYYSHLVEILGIKGYILADQDDLTSFIFLPFANHSDFLFYSCMYPDETVLQYHYNWHYWAKGCHPYLLYHRKDVLGYDDRYWGYHFASTLHFPSYNDSFYPYYDGTDIYFFSGRCGIPDYAMLNNYNNQQVYFPARPVKK